MKVALRVDASLDIGIGHVMRCLTLADALSEQGATCVFACRAFPGNLIDVIRQRNHQVRALPFAEQGASQTISQSGDAQLAHAAWLGADWAEDAGQTRVALGDMPFDWLIVDHYGIDVRWEHSLRHACRSLMVIDDITDRTHDCDVLLNQNLGRSAADYGGLIPPGCRVLAGPTYALLRPEFAALRPRSLARRATPRLEHLLITMGGVDKDNATGMVLDALRGCPLPAACRISVVMGPHAPWLERIRSQATRMPWATEVLLNVGNMAELMADCDLAIGAAGSTSWERCALGLPSIIVVLAENQQAIQNALDLAGAAKAISLETLRADIKAFFSRPDTLASTLAHIATCAATVTDGSGAAAMVRTLLELENS